MKKKIIFFFFCISLFFLKIDDIFSDLVFLKNNLKSIYSRIHLHYEIKNKKWNKKDKIHVRIYIPHHFTNGFNKQFVSNFNFKSYPKADKVLSLVDHLNNEYLDLNFSDLKNKSFEKIDIEIQFSSYIETEIPKIKKLNPFPINIPKSNYFKPYKQESLYTLKNSKMEAEVQKIIKNVQSQEEAVIKIFLWIKKHIKEDNNIIYYDAIQTFDKKKGHLKGLLNLFLSFLRIAEIPCRFVYGISLENEFILKNLPNKIPIKIMNDLNTHYWIEIYFPYRDWIPFDFSLYSFAIPPYYIRKHTGLDSESNLDFIKGISKEEEHFYLSEIHFNIFSYKQTEKVSLFDELKVMPFDMYYIFMPFFVDFNFMNLIKDFGYQDKQNKQIKIEEKNPNTSTLIKKEAPQNLNKDFQISFENKNLDFKNSKLLIQNEISSVYQRAQKIEIPFNLDIELIEIPLFSIQKNPDTLLWLELYEVSNNLDNPFGALIKSSEKVKMSFFESAENYEWIPFIFNKIDLLEKNENDFQKETKKIWVLLKIRGESLFLWPGSLGNPFQEKLDSILIKKSSFKYEYLDLYFRIFARLL